MRRVVSKGFFDYFVTCTKLTKKVKFLCNYVKISQNLAIYLHAIASIWLLGIYNCCSNMLRIWEEWFQKVFSLLSNSTCVKLVKTLKFLCDYLKIWLFKCKLLLKIWLLGIYNCSKKYVKKSKIVEWKIFHYFGN